MRQVGTNRELLAGVGGEGAPLLLQHAVERLPRWRHPRARPPAAAAAHTATHSGLCNKQHDYITSHVLIAFNNKLFLIANTFLDDCFMLLSNVYLSHITL